MGWYHYECVDGSCDVNKVVPCPDGTCPMPPGAAGAAAACASTTTTTTTNSDASTSTNAAAAATDEDAVAQNQPQQQVEEEEELYDAITPIYHLCQKKLWMEAIATQQPYYPPTFWKDGRFTRASCDADSLPMTANHYYQGAAGDWLCLQLDPVRLRQLGMPIAVHREQQQQRYGKNSPIQCLKVFGGIPTMIDQVVLNVYAMQRDGHGYFYGRSRDTTVPKNALTPTTTKSSRLPEQVQRRGTSTMSTSSPSSSSSPSWRFWQKKNIT